MDSRVSVIIPTYNRRHWLGETLDSVYAQTLHDYEVIVIDDGSTDDTATLVGAYKDRIGYERIAHAGASAARNAGLARACGDYVAFLDSDDVWENTFLERTVAALDGSPGAGFVYCDYATFGAEGVKRNSYLPAQHKLNGNVFAALLETDFISTGALMIRHQCLAHVGGFDPTLAVAQDWDLWLRLARDFDAVYVDEPLIRIRTSSDGLTRNTLQLHIDNLRVLAKWAPRVENAIQQQIIERNARASHRALSRHYARSHQGGPAIRHWVRSVTGGVL